MLNNMQKVPFVNLGAQFDRYENEFVAKFKEIGTSGQYILGKEVQLLEQEINQFLGSNNCVAVANGSDALFLILKAYGIGQGDEVITAPNSFIASAWVIIATGATPVFVDVDETYNIDVSKLEDAITPSTRAIMPVHLAGNPCDMDEINQIAQKHNLVVIEDAAQAIGAIYKERMVGTLGHAAGISLHPLKNLGVFGDAGLITCKDSEIASRMRKLRNHGLVNRDEVEIWGYNSRLDEMQAGFARIKLGKMQELNLQIKRIAEFYTQELAEYCILPQVRENRTSVFHNYIIMTKSRDSLRDFLIESGVETRVHYPIPIHLQKAANNLGYKLGDFPKAEKQSTNSLSLPIYPELSDSQIEYVASQIKTFIKKVL